jgi:cobyrinic acid a,c-diamide synthase
MTDGLLIAAPRSSSGKTVITLALVAALRRRGVAVRTAKSGPDYIDPQFHAAAAGAPSRNLDSFAMHPPLLDAVASRAAQGADLLVIESAMGLFDGAGNTSGRTGAAADIAIRLGLPVVLVLDISGQAQTAAAVARGFAAHDPRLRLAGVVLNRVASKKHLSMAADSIAATGLKILGHLPRDLSLTLPERHLGLVQAAEHPDLGNLLIRLADLAERNFALDTIRSAASPLPEAGNRIAAMAPPGQTIALARDDAFSFCYPHLLDDWRSAGASVEIFSPLADEAPPAGCDICWLPGGYPELHAAKLAANARFLAGLRQFTGRIHGECGGYMVLGKILVDADGVAHEMAGLLSHSTSFARRKMVLGYRQARLLVNLPIGAAGAVIRGHEFHYATLTDPGDDLPIAELFDAAGEALGPAGGRRGKVSGSFFHAIAMEPP